MNTIDSVHLLLCSFHPHFHHLTSMVRLVFVWIDVKTFSRNLCPARESSGVVRDLSPLFYYFSYGAHLFKLRRTRCKDGSLRTLSTVAAMSQVQATHTCTMLCEIIKTKYLRGETRSFCSNRLIVSGITFVQINSFLCTNKFLHMLCRIAMRGSCDTKTWSREQLWMGNTKSANLKRFRATSTSGPSSIAT